MSEALPTGSVIGILGGGQLGRMLSVAASRLGYKTCIFEPSADCPASHVANYHLQAEYTDEAALAKFAASVNVITYEFENIPTSALDFLEGKKPIRPGRAALAKSQDRLTEKAFLGELGLKTAPYANVESIDDLRHAVEAIGTPSILKTRRFGYDGKGQVRLRESSNLTEVWNAMAGAPSVLEGFVDFSIEISLIAARGLNGEVICFDPGENVHRDGILHTTTVPAKIPAAMRLDGALMAGKILTSLDYVGVMGVELFVTQSGMVVNEIAPRVHNSGHWTQAGCCVDQFEQHIRAITGQPLGSGERYADVEMLNLIGNDVDALDKYMSAPKTQIHLYGKREAKAGRKMGHVNRIL